MYPPQYNLPPINPAAFGGLPPQGGPQGGPPPTQGGPQGGPPMDMNKYLIDPVRWAQLQRRRCLNPNPNRNWGRNKWGWDSDWRGLSGS